MNDSPRFEGEGVKVASASVPAQRNGQKFAGGSSRPSLHEEGPSSPACGRSPKVGTATARTEIPHLVGDEGASMAATGGARQCKHSRQQTDMQTDMYV